MFGNNTFDVADLPYFKVCKIRYAGKVEASRYQMRSKQCIELLRLIPDSDLSICNLSPSLGSWAPGPMELPVWTAV